MKFSNFYPCLDGGVFWTFGFHFKLIRSSYVGKVKTVVGCLLLTVGLYNDNLKLINFRLTLKNPQFCD